MAIEPYNHFIEIDEKTRLVTIYRVFETHRDLYTSVQMPNTTWQEHPEQIREFCRLLGENIILDSPQARRLLEI